MSFNKVFIKTFGRVDYQHAWQAMQGFTADRTPQTTDEIWLLEHPSVFTQGQAGKPEHVLNPGNIPVIPTDRGGQVTYHGPGQLLVYCLLDLKRLGLGIRELVTALEETVVEHLKLMGISALPRADAPGVYVDGAKIASVGLRVSRSCTFHGLSLNIDMDLEPFSRINPCGLTGISVTQIAEFDKAVIFNDVREAIALTLCDKIDAEAVTVAVEKPDIIDIPC